MALSHLLLWLLSTGGINYGTAFTSLSKPSSPKFDRCQQVHALPLDPDLAQEVSTARAAFALFGFGAVGTAALGRGALPVLWKRYQFTRSLKGKGPSLGGDPLSLPLVTGYPEDLYMNDVNNVLNNNLTAAEIVEQFPIEKAIPGYLTYDAFALANADCNPLASRAIYESLSVSSEIVVPARAQQNLEIYKTDIGVMVDNLTKKKTLAASAALILMTLLGAADYLALYHFWKGWFPEWQGLDYLPGSLFDPDIGLFAIPKYWI